jgi:hypothetical protein
MDETTTTISSYGRPIECYNKKLWLQSLNAENLMRLFEIWEKKKLSDTPYHLYDEAWEVYLLQIVRDMLFDNAGFSLDWIPMSFTKVSFETQKCLDYNRFKHFVNFIEGYDYGPIYGEDEDSVELLTEILEDYGKEKGGSSDEDLQSDIDGKPGVPG